MSPDLAQRLWARVERGGPDQCWPWSAPTLKDGYGRITVGGRKWLAHRAAWTVTNGDIPEGLSVCHRCDNPPCCNPDHLFLGTHAENMRDCQAKGRRKGLRGSANATAKITEADVVEMRRLRREGWTFSAIGRRFGVHLSSVFLIVKGKTWRHVEAA